VTIVGISPNAQQTIKSFGASGAWWPHFLNDFPSAQQQNLSRLLFSGDWLYLSGYRYNSKHEPKFLSPNHVRCSEVLPLEAMDNARR